MTKVLVFSNDHVGTSMAGPGIRSYHFARELAREFDVTLMVPRPTDIDLAGVEIVEVSGLERDELEREIGRFDVVVAQFLPIRTMRRLAARGTRVIYDLYIPFVERLGFLDTHLDGAKDSRSEALFAAGSRLTQRLALASGSAFLCANERQRDLWLGMLAGLGRIDLDVYRRDPTLRNVIDVVPFGLPAEAPVRAGPVLKGVRDGIGERDRVLLWAGGVWNWLDPLTPIRAVERISARRDDVKLVFLGLERPLSVGQTAMAARAVELARSLGALDRSVFFNFGWIPYGERQAYLLEADIGVSAHFASLETHFAFRTRLLDYFWAGLPIVTTGGDTLAEVVGERGLGRVVDEGDAGAWEAAIEALLDDEHARQRLAPRFRSVQQEFAWPSATAPLARLVREGLPLEPRRWPVERMMAEDAALRLRTSLALGGPRALLRRQARKLTRGGRA